jgi:hypothetical protein
MTWSHVTKVEKIKMRLGFDGPVARVKDKL